jgi:DNA polymerase III alpha subunit
VDCHVDLRLGELQVPRLTGLADTVAAGELHRRCWEGVAARYPRVTPKVRDRLERELAMVDRLGLHDYFLTVGEVMAEIRRDLGVLAACRGSAAGSLVCYALRISDVDPIAHDLAFERFMNPYRDELPDIDIDVESHRREDVYDLVIARYGQHRTACVAMVETFQARMAIREVGKVLGLPPDEIGHVAAAFTHARARDVRRVLAALPELKGSNIDAGQLETLLTVVERIDGLPRHLAMHPCGILLANDDLLDRTPIERSAQGFPMTCFDKDDVAALGWLKLDVLGVRMLSAMRHAMDLVPHTRGQDFDVADIPDGDPDTYELVRSTHTIGMFQIESPGQRELIGRLLPDDLGDLVTEISLFRPGPVKADMVTPFVRRRHGQEPTAYLHPSLEPVLARHPRRDHLPRTGDGGAVRPDRVRHELRRPVAPAVVGPGSAAGHPWLGAGAGSRPRIRRRRCPGRVGPGRLLRVVRVLQGPRRGLRGAHLPVGLDEAAPVPGTDGRAAHPRPRHVSTAADPGRVSDLRCRGPAPRRQPVAGPLHRGGDRPRPGRPPAGPAIRCSPTRLAAR